MKKKDITSPSVKEILEEIQSDFLTGDNSEFRTYTATTTGNNTAGIIYNTPYTFINSIPDLNVGDLVKKRIRDDEIFTDADEIDFGVILKKINFYSGNPGKYSLVYWNKREIESFEYDSELVKEKDVK